MKALFLLQWQRLKREPLLIGSMMVMTIVFVLAMGGFRVSSAVSVPTYFDASVQNQKAWLERLNEATEGFEFFATEENRSKEDIALGKYPYALQVMEDDFRIFMLAEDENLQVLKQVVAQTYLKEKRVSTAAAQVDEPEQFRKQVKEYLSEPPIIVSKVTPGPLEGAPSYNQKLQTLYGMSLFFAMYTIIFSLSKIAEEKRTGTLNRIILSPIRKWQVYIGHMSYSYVIGFTQIVLIVLMFKYIFGYNVGEQMGAVILTIASFVFAVVAIGMLILGLIKSTDQLNAVVPIVTVSMAMLGGAFWPIEIVSNDIILAISNVVPMTYAMEALKAVSMFGQGLADIYEPLAILVLIGVLCMGVGVNLIERKA
ncbi:ABC transporter permease [Filobacillus milosensis]|uniref:ABC transporter permease n=1 Tax=Filobacillus milosensis TaxID=94137 RepID=A0A4Y8IV01_9BACI|nr:ABC transporter permease [Filobacillus milosensis]TFB22928.1 ABC transporter permease [Filobacillus milosensis]